MSLTQPRSFDSRANGFAVAILVLITLAAFQPIVTNGNSFEFLNADDNKYVTENPHVASGLSLANLRWAFMEPYFSNWHPLTWASLQLDAQLYGIHPWGFHLTNLLLHTLNALLLFALLRLMTGAPGRSLVVAGLFAVHPLHVESVAWVTERKDVLSTFFGLLTMLAYVGYSRRPGVLRYLAILFLYAFCLLSKAMLVTLPVLLLLLDAWPLERLRRSIPARPAAFQPTLWLRLVVEKLPLLAMGAVCTTVNAHAQERMMNAVPAFPLFMRVENALVYYATYIGRMFWPFLLGIFHANEGKASDWPVVLGAAALFAACSVVAWREWAQRPFLLIGWLWFLVALLPVIGLVQLGFVSTTDHYTYVPLIGLFIVLVWSAAEAVERWSTSRIVAVSAAALPLLLCIPITRHQLQFWRTSVTLWGRSVEVAPDRAIPHLMLSRALESQGRHLESDAEFARAITDRQEFDLLLVAMNEPSTMEHLAAQFVRVGRIDLAIPEYARLAKAQPLKGDPEYNLGLLYAQLGEFSKARDHLNSALARQPDDKDAQIALEKLPPDTSRPAVLRTPVPGAPAPP